MTNNEKVAEIRKIVERYDGQKPELIEISIADDAFVYQAKMANSQAVEVAKVLLAEIDRLQEEIQSTQQEIENLKTKSAHDFYVIQNLRGLEKQGEEREQKLIEGLRLIKVMRNEPLIEPEVRMAEVAEKVLQELGVME